MDSEVYIISAVRTPIAVGRSTGALNYLHPVDLTAAVMRKPFAEHSDPLASRMQSGAA
jgi:acetyl-CoA acetyltransferase